jgi:hypothetical protein
MVNYDLGTTNQGAPTILTNFTRNNTEPAVAGGALWGDSVNMALYLFGGQTTGHGHPHGGHGGHDGFSLFDLNLNQWNHSQGDRGQGGGGGGFRQHKVSWGASTSVDELGQGYFLGGWRENRTAPSAVGQRASSHLLRYDMTSGSFTNLSGPDHVGRAEGVMIFLPVSDAGLLVYIGGVLDPQRNGSVVPAPMEIVHVFDIATTTWYSQRASGDIPPVRRRFCAGATWPDDRTSLNIYAYGGLSAGADGNAFDDLYILSLPSFQYLKWWPTKPSTGRPRHSMTCNVVGRSQVRYLPHGLF